jgi:hypothetical protein
MTTPVSAFIYEPYLDLVGLLEQALGRPVELVTGVTGTFRHSPPTSSLPDANGHRPRSVMR